MVGYSKREPLVDISVRLEHIMTTQAEIYKGLYKELLKQPNNKRTLSCLQIIELVFL